MGPIRLAFNGTDKGVNHPLPAPLPDWEQAVKSSMPVFSPMAGGVQQDTVIYVSVEFNVPIGGGVVVLLIPTLEGGLAFETFERNGATKLVSVPFTEKGIYIYHIDPFQKGFVVVSSTK